MDSRLEEQDHILFPAKMHLGATDPLSSTYIPEEKNRPSS